jgi:hypothetical protein
LIAAAMQGCWKLKELFFSGVFVPVTFVFHLTDSGQVFMLRAKAFDQWSCHVLH